MAFTMKPKAGIPAKGQPRPGGAINQGGQSTSHGSTFTLPSKSTGTMKKSSGASRGFSKAQQPMQDGPGPMTPSLAGLIGRR